MSGQLGSNSRDNHPDMPNDLAQQIPQQKPHCDGPFFGPVELHIETTWYRRTALEDLFGVSGEKIHADRLYGGLDWLLPHKAVIEKHLKDRLGSLFDLEYELLLYDITSTYFEGECKANPLARRGYGSSHK